MAAMKLATGTEPIMYVTAYAATGHDTVIVHSVHRSQDAARARAERDNRDWFPLCAVPSFRKTRRPVKGDRLTRMGHSEVVPPDADLPLPL
jgi:hypothetical protein